LSTIASRPLRADARRNREKVLAAAGAAFAEVGLDAQVEDIARRAIVGVGTVYRHFPTKEALVDALAGAHFEQLADIVEASDRGGDPWDAFAGAIWRCAESTAGNVALCEIVGGRPSTVAPSAGQRRLEAASARLIDGARAWSDPRRCDRGRRADDHVRLRPRGGGPTSRRAARLAALPHHRPRRAARPVTWPQRLLSVAFMTTGIMHFLRPATYEQIMPDYLPAHHELVLLSGAAEIAGGVGVAFARSRRVAGLWLVALLVLVFPANVDMALHAERFRSIGPTLLWARLPLQGLLIWWVYRATRTDRERSRASIRAAG
jgi:uncharacterized membrane protein